MYYKPKHFKIQELVPKQVFEDRGEKAWELFDSQLLVTLDLLRERYGTMTVNNWHWNGSREWSGLRVPNSPYYRPYSMHSFGKAADIIFHDTSAEVVRNDIIEDSKQFRHDDTFIAITALELDTSWCHIDTRNKPRLFTFKP